MNFKKCACCGRYTLAAGWSVLRYVGEQGDEEETVELRNCPCGNTLAVVLEFRVLRFKGNVLEKSYGAYPTRAAAGEVALRSSEKHPASFVKVQPVIKEM